jgi:hypothetical protein
MTGIIVLIRTALSVKACSDSSCSLEQARSLATFGHLPGCLIVGGKSMASIILKVNLDFPTPARWLTFG